MSSVLAPLYKGVQYLQIPADFVSQRLDNFLRHYLKKIPKTRLYRMLRQGEVRVNKHRVKAQYRLVAHDLLRIPPVYESTTPICLPLSELSRNAELIERAILYEDSSLLILNKPAGIAVHGGSGLRFGIIEVLRYLKGPQIQLELAHRLDRDTSGCLLVSKKRSTLKALHTLFRNAQVQKHYLALLKGQWQGSEKISAPLLRYHLDSGERRVRVAPEGKVSITEVIVLKAYGGSNGYCLILAKPKTGRTHQIRVHTNFVGNPIIGDVKYGDRHLNAQFETEGFGRLFLHASCIAFQLTGESFLKQTAPIDAMWDRCLAQLQDKN